MLRLREVNIFLTINASHSLFKSDLGLIVKMVRVTKTTVTAQFAKQTVNMKYFFRNYVENLLLPFNGLLNPFVSLLNLNVIPPFNIFFKNITVLESFGGDKYCEN